MMPPLQRRYRVMRLPFTKMQGAGNDFVVLDGTRATIQLTPEQLRRLGDRRFGVGADQILAVERSSTPGVDFRCRIFKGASGDEVEHCGNGAHCLVRHVQACGLSDKTTVRVETVNNVLELQLRVDGRVTVDMRRPVFEHTSIPFDAGGLLPRQENGFQLWPLQGVRLAVLSMGNPHAVQRVADVDSAPVATLGPQIETHARFPRHVNVGFVQEVSRSEVRLRGHTSPHGQRPVSLQERQMEMLRDRIKGLEHRIVEIIRHGQENIAIADSLHRTTFQCQPHDALLRS